MKRAHAPLGRHFDAAVEAFSDLMLENPVRQADDMALRVEELDKPFKFYDAQVTLPDGRVLKGFVRKLRDLPEDHPKYGMETLSKSRIAAELLVAMVGADVGAPTVPYMYFADQQLLFSPIPFKGAEDQNAMRIKHVRGSYSEEPLFSRVHADALGAIEPFLRWLGKYDDTTGNRVQNDDRAMALLDNALIGYENDRSTTHIDMARRSCKYGPRALTYRRTRLEMESRIATYQPARLNHHALLIAQHLDVSRAHDVLLRRRKMARYEP